MLVCVTTQIVALHSNWIQNVETEESSRYISVKSPFAQATGRGAGRAKEVAGHRAFLCQREIPRGPPWSDLGRKVQDDSAPCETWALKNRVQRAQAPHVMAEACQERLSGVSRPPPDSKHTGQRIDAWDPSSCFPCGARGLWIKEKKEISTTSFGARMFYFFYIPIGWNCCGLLFATFLRGLMRLEPFS